MHANLINTCDARPAGYGLFATHTSPEVLDALRAVVGRPMTAAERFEQRVSFVYGQVGGDITKERVRAHLEAL